MELREVEKMDVNQNYIYIIYHVYTIHIYMLVINSKKRNKTGKKL